MTEPTKPRVSKWMLIGFFIMGIASFAGLGALITGAVQKVISGHALDTYRTVWLVEFNYIGVLVMFGAIVAVFVVAVVAVAGPAPGLFAHYHFRSAASTSATVLGTAALSTS